MIVYECNKFKVKFYLGCMFIFVYFLIEEMVLELEENIVGLAKIGEECIEWVEYIFVSLVRKVIIWLKYVKL